MATAEKRALRRVAALTRPFLTSPARGFALGWFALLISLLILINLLNVINSLVGRDFMTAVEQRQPWTMYRQAVLYVAVFAGLTAGAVFQRFAEERFGLLWRQWFTAHLIDRYLANGAYRRINEAGQIDNPDQRITDDVKLFTTNTLSLVLIFVNSTITFFAFAGILWSITPWLLVVAVGYAALGSALSILVGRRLVGLNVLQLQKEADLRYELVRVREHAEAIGLQHTEERERISLGGRLSEVIRNNLGIVRVNRNLGFFVNGYNYLTQIIPVLVVAPLYIRGEVAFGVVTQSSMAFTMVLGAFSLVVSQFERISTYAAVVQRLSALGEALDEQPTAGPAIEPAGKENGVAFDRVTIASPADGRVLVRDLSIDVPAGRRLLIHGPHGAGKSALLRAAAGAWKSGHGRILRPERADVFFLASKPYLRRGPLRPQLIPEPGDRISDQQLHLVLLEVGIVKVIDDIGGVDADRDWPTLLSLAEQQVLGFAKLFLANPRVALLEHATNALDPTAANRLYELLSRSQVTYVTVGESANLPHYHDAVLELAANGEWRVAPSKESPNEDGDSHPAG
jgi:putative ATP-binding cassette transporter